VEKKARARERERAGVRNARLISYLTVTGTRSARVSHDTPTAKGVVVARLSLNERPPFSDLRQE